MTRYEYAVFIHWKFHPAIISGLESEFKPHRSFNTHLGLHIKDNAGERYTLPQKGAEDAIRRLHPDCWILWKGDIPPNGMQAVNPRLRYAPSDYDEGVQPRQGEKVGSGWAKGAQLEPYSIVSVSSDVVAFDFDSLRLMNRIAEDGWERTGELPIHRDILQGLPMMRRLIT